MKKLILLLLLLPIVNAQSLDISMIEYNAETNVARIQIANNMGQDIHNVEYQLNTFPKFTIVNTLKDGGAAVKVLNLKGGEYKFTVYSDEVTQSENLIVRNSFEEIQEKIKEDIIEKKEERRDEETLKKHLASVTSVKKKTNYFRYSAIALVLIAIIVGFVIYFMKRKKNEII